MKQCKNLEAAKQLVINYRAITLEDIKEVVNNLFINSFSGTCVCAELTGFGYCHQCILCKAIDGLCSECIYSPDTVSCIKQSTYQNIKNAGDEYELLDALNARADYIESLIKEIENDN